MKHRSSLILSAVLPTNPADRWRLGAKVVAIGCVAMAAYQLPFIWGAFRTIGSWGDMGDLLFLLFWSFCWCGLFAWVAFRLWRHWNSQTVRWAVGSIMGVALLGISGRVASHFRADAEDILFAPAVIIGGILYSRIVHWIIRAARLEDPLGPDGLPIGHATRIKAFSSLLGFSIWIGAFTLLFRYTRASNAIWAECAAAFGPLLAGYLVYRIVLWRMSPTPPSALPTGYGFEVIPTSNSRPVAGRDEPAGPTAEPPDEHAADQCAPS